MVEVSVRFSLIRMIVFSSQLVVSCKASRGSPDPTPPMLSLADCVMVLGDFVEVCLVAYDQSLGRLKRRSHFIALWYRTSWEYSTID
ncbi:hypothetical protein B296_00053248 [Ensete ventricosum]|uniref:Secreted protein n=1 Tax=Ensete ventricosum TaxID=4639 RepID=A0A426Y530_ENSVE|nr:hypothetical protein B296_00053248 [Ensete ventricosum]